MKENPTDNYRGAFDGSLGFGRKPAVILVDLVRAYFDKDSALYTGVESALAAAIRVRDAARGAGVPVIYTNVVYQNGGADGGVFFRKVPALEAFISGNPLGDRHPAPHEANLFDIQAKYGDVVDEAATVDYLARL